MANKRISLITLHTPTPENIRGASALPYHLIENRPVDIEITIYSFNVNKIDDTKIQEVSKTLKCELRILRQNLFCRILLSRWIKPFKALMPLPVFNYLKLSKKMVELIEINSDFIWVYGEELACLTKYFPNKRAVVTTPDCEAMYYQRVLSLPSKITKYNKMVRYGRAYWQYLNEVSHFPSENVIYHLVGQEDRDFIQAIDPNIRAVFIPHPHYEGNLGREIKFSAPKIKIIIPGRYDFYCSEAVDEAVNALINSRHLIDKYAFTFQGKAWDNAYGKLKEAGFEVELKGFVPVYRDELCKHDIQLSPISVGTGTKGKVLDAFVNGLLVVGTKRAVENIKVNNKTEVIQYEKTEDLIKYLDDIMLYPENYEEMANMGRKAVLTYHDPMEIARQFFSLFEI